MKWFKRSESKPQEKAKSMKVFSEENLQKLHDEHQLITLTIQRINRDVHRMGRVGVDNEIAAMRALTVRRVELEYTIDTLREVLS